jgi:hypothetical protein
MSRDRAATEQAIAALVERYIAMRCNASDPL